MLSNALLKKSPPNQIAMLHGESFLVGIDSKLQHMNYFPLHVTFHGITRIRGSGMGETTLAKSICNKWLSLNRHEVNNSGGLLCVADKSVFFCQLSPYCSEVGDSESGTNITRNRLFSQKYLRIFDDRDRYGDLNEVAHGAGDMSSSRFVTVEDIKEYDIREKVPDVFI